MLDNLKRIDEELTAAKKFYNTYIGDSNELVRKFPSNIVANMGGFKKGEFFQIADADKEAPTVKF